LVESLEHSHFSEDPDYVPYDKRKLSYANTFPDPWQRNTIRTIEWMTGKMRLLRLIRRFERAGVPQGQPFWKQALHHMRIDLLTPEEQIARVPRDGPLIVVANHPHGLVDGMILAELIGRVREDYKILTRSLLTGIEEIKQFMIPVPFPHEENSQKKFLEMRRRAMEHLATGGVVALFPSGVVASADRYFGPAVEREWNVFTAKMIMRSGAAVVPIFFPGSNSRWYQIASLVSPPVRQGLLIHEVAHALGRPQTPVVGEPWSFAELEERGANPRAFMEWLRTETLGLGKS